MTNKRLMQGKNGELIVTVAKEDGKVYQGYLKQGYKHIGYASGFDLSVSGILKKK